MTGRLAPTLATRAVCAFFRGVSLCLCAHYYRIPYPAMCDLIRGYQPRRGSQRVRGKGAR